MRLTDEQLEKRRSWEACAANAYQQPDEAVLEMIKEIQERRAEEKKRAA